MLKNTATYFLLYALCGTCSLYGQNATVDSLLTFINVSKADSNKVKALNALSFELRNSDPQKAMEYAQEAGKLGDVVRFEKGVGVAEVNLAVCQINTGDYDLAIENANKGLKTLEKYSDPFNKGRAYNTIGEAYRFKDNYSEALKYYQLAFKIRTESGDQKGIASVLNNIGIIHFNLGNYPEALKKHLEALKIREGLRDQQAIAASYNNIALVYLKQQNFSDALRYNDLALKIRTEQDDKRGMASSYTNIANIQRINDQVTDALKNYSLALEMFTALGDKKNIAGSYNNIGCAQQIEADTLFAHNDVAAATARINAAISNLSIAEKIYAEIGSNSGAILIAQNLGHANRSLKKYPKAKEYYLAGLKIAIKIGSKEEMKNFYLDLSKTEALTGNFKSAYENHKLFILYRDRLDNEETRKKTIQSQMTYEFEKKEAVAEAEYKKEIENQQAIASEKSRKQRIIIGAVLAGLILVLAFAVFVFRSLRITRKQKDLIEEQKGILEIQKQEVETQKAIVEEKQKEIIDSITYARRIQRSLLPTEKYIQNSINRLKARK
jgi:tetratricopeptide (TPR) repeat protein